jgi:hypothetical protein
MIEIALLQRTSVFLGHPVYALSVVPHETAEYSVRRTTGSQLQALREAGYIDPGASCHTC